MNTHESQQNTVEKELENPRYALITPARNEEAFIEKTLDSMIQQTALPERWVIVSDGSTDRTEEIVEKYANRHEWIRLIKRRERTTRHFTGKVHAFNAGYEELKDLDYEILGNLDADISFDQDYFSFLMKKFSQNSNLGIAGTPFREGSKQYDFRFANIEHVSGACTLSRRKCFEEIGGYLPIRIGGEDLYLGIAARHMGWETRTFPEKHCIHHKAVIFNTSLKSMWRAGYNDYILGMHPLWEIARLPYWMGKKPIIIGGLAHLITFFWGLITRAKIVAPEELVSFRRKEQMYRLRKIISNMFSTS